jgi:hypothetical protein
VDAAGAVVEPVAGGARRIIAADTVVLSLGVKADEGEVLAFEGVCGNVMYVGDCADPGGTLYNTVHTAFDAAMSLC